MRTAAVILAAGLSSRMGSFKPLLEIGGRTLAQRAVDLFYGAGVSEVVTVVGRQRDELIPVLESAGSGWVLNRDYRRGMFSSVRKGVEAIGQSCDAFFVMPVDFPLVRRLTVERLVEAFAGGSFLVCHPAFEGRRGHPPLIDAGLIDDIRAFGGEGGLRAFLRKHEGRARDVPVADAYIHRDVNTPGDLAAMRKAFERYAIPSEDECLALLDHHFTVDDGVRAHCRAVASVARRMGEALNRQGHGCDPGLLTAAGLLHDVFKGRENHAAMAAGALSAAGFPSVAEVVASHMDLGAENTGISERALLYLADRMVQEERVVSLDDRRSSMLEKFAHDPRVQEKIRERFDTAGIVRSRVEEALGSSLDGLLGVS